MTRMTGPDCVVMCNLINTHTHTHTWLVPRYLLPPSSRCVDVWRGWVRRESLHQGVRHQTGRAQVGDALQRVPASGRGYGSSTSPAADLFCFTASTFIPHASPSLQTEGGVCEHPTAPFARPGSCTHAHRAEGVTGSEGREGANGGGHGDLNGDGNGRG